MARDRGCETSRRAAAELAKGLRRGDAERALAGLLGLPPEDRGPHVADVERLLLARIRADHRAGRWNALHRTALEVLREPRLLGTQATDEERCEALWSLVWGCALSSDFARARRLWDGWPPEARERAGPLGRAMTAYLAAEGRPEAGAVLPVLGNESGAPPPSRPAAPEGQEQVASAVLTVFGNGWTGFARTVETWAERVHPEVARSIRILAARLTVWEYLRRRQAGRHALDLAQQFTRFVEGLGAPPELAEDVLLLMRLVVPEGALGDATEAGLFVRLLAIAHRYDAHGPLVAEAFIRTAVGPAARRVVLPLARQILAKTPSFRVWVKAHSLWQEDGDMAAPEWLGAELRSMLERDPASVAAWFEAAPAAERAGLLDSLAEDLPLDLGCRLVDVLWRDASEVLRRSLAHLVAMLVSRANVPVAPSQSSRHASRGELADAMDRAHARFGELPAELAELFSLAENDARWRGMVCDALDAFVDDRLSGQALALWNRLGRRALSYSADLLEIALANAPSDAEALAAVDEYMSRRQDVDGWLEARRAACVRERHHLEPAIVARLIERHGDVESLARALSSADAADELPEVGAQIAAALLDAHARQPGPRSPLAEEMLRLAGRLAGKTRQRKKRGASRGRRRTRRPEELPL